MICKLCKLIIENGEVSNKCTNCNQDFHRYCLKTFSNHNPFICPECQVNLINSYFKVTKIQFFEKLENKIVKFKNSDEKEEKYYLKFDKPFDIYNKNNKNSSNNNIVKIIYCLKGGANIDVLRTSTKPQPFNNSWPVNFKLTLIRRFVNSDIKTYFNFMIKDKEESSYRASPIAIFPSKSYFLKNKIFSIFKNWEKSNIFFLDDIKNNELIQGKNKHKGSILDKYDLRIVSKYNKRDPADSDYYYIVIADIEVLDIDFMLNSYSIIPQKSIQEKFSDSLVKSEKFSLMNEYTLKLMEFPGRGQYCKHFMCFCLKSYLLLRMKKYKHTCDICKMPVGKLYLDELFKNVLLKNRNNRLTKQKEISEIIISGEYQIIDYIYEDRIDNNDSDSEFSFSKKKKKETEVNEEMQINKKSDLIPADSINNLNDVNKEGKVGSKKNVTQNWLITNDNNKEINNNTYFNSNAKIEVDTIKETHIKKHEIEIPNHIKVHQKPEKDKNKKEILSKDGKPIQFDYYYEIEDDDDTNSAKNTNNANIAKNVYNANSKNNALSSQKSNNNIKNIERTKDNNISNHTNNTTRTLPLPILRKEDTLAHKKFNLYSEDSINNRSNKESSNHNKKNNINNINDFCNQNTSVTNKTSSNFNQSCNNERKSVKNIKRSSGIEKDIRGNIKIIEELDLDEIKNRNIQTDDNIANIKEKKQIEEYIKKDLEELQLELENFMLGEEDGGLDENSYFNKLYYKYNFS